MLLELFEEIKSATGTNSLRDNIYACRLPLVPEMLDNLGYSYDIDEAYSVTNATYLPNLIKIQHKHNSISTFTKGGKELAKLPSHPNILLKLSGNVVIEAASDLWTFIDPDGHRWMGLSPENTKEGTKYSEQLAFFIKGIRDKILKELGYININDKTIFSVSDKDLDKFYKIYIVRIEEYLEKSGFKLLTKHLKENITYSYNEIVLNEFSINGVYQIDVEIPNITKQIEDNELKYLGVISMKDIIKLDVR